MNRRIFLKGILGLATLQVASIIVTPAENFKNNLVDMTTKNNFTLGLGPGDFHIEGWEFPSNDNDNKYIHHCKVVENGKTTYYLDGSKISLTDKKALLI